MAGGRLVGGGHRLCRFYWVTLRRRISRRSHRWATAVPVETTSFVPSGEKQRSSPRTGVGGVSVAMAHDVAELTQLPRPPRGREETPAVLARLLEAHEIVLKEARAMARRATEAGDDSGCRRVIVVHIKRGQRRQLEKRRLGVEQTSDSVAYRKLALIAVPLQVCRPAALTHRGKPFAQLTDQLPHAVPVREERLVGRADV